jgi:sirohydrochlorin ferrochelatase
VISSGWAPALIGLVGVLAGAFIAAVAATVRERVGRRDKTQQEALYALQDACLAHRQAYQALFAAQDELPSGGAFVTASREVDRTRQVLDVTEARVLCGMVLARMAAWRAVVAPAMLRDDVRDVSATEEDTAWKAVQASVREELRWLSSRRTR